MKTRLLFAIMALALLTSLVSSQDIGIDPVHPINYPPLMTVHDIPGGACLPVRDAPHGGGVIIACLEEGYYVTLHSETALDSNFKWWRRVSLSGVLGWLPMTRNGNPILFRG